MQLLGGQPAAAAVAVKLAFELVPHTSKRLLDYRETPFYASLQ